MAMRFAIVADDLSGACDSGVQVARGGYRTLVWLDSSQPIPAGFDAVAVDTDSRTCSAYEAASKVKQAVAVLSNAEILYKKIDSTLRGNIGVEVRTMLETSGRKKAIVAPAFPAPGRVTRGSLQYLDGIPVHRTNFAQDPLNPVDEGHIPTLLARGGLGQIGVLERSRLNPAEIAETFKSHNLLVADVEFEEDFVKLIRSVQTPEELLWVGSAGLLRGMAEVFPGDASPPKRKERASKVLTVVGSVHPCSRVQLEHLSQHVPSVELKGIDLVHETGKTVLELLNQNLGVALYSPLASSDPKAIANALAEIVFDVQDQLEGLVLTGGDTAIHVLRRLEISGIELETELEPGIPVGYARGGQKRWVIVTKAGGFGSPQALSLAHRVVSGLEKA